MSKGDNMSVNTKPFFVEFADFNDDDDTVKITRYSMVPPIFEGSFYSDEGTEFDELVRTLEEKYGVLDVGFCPDSELYGFNSYEIGVDYRVAVMHEFRDFFEGMSGTALEIDVSVTVDGEA